MGIHNGATGTALHHLCVLVHWSCSVNWTCVWWTQSAYTCYTDFTQSTPWC